MLFITTANDASTIPGPLYDRMDVIELPSYTRTEKFNIAKRHLLPKQLKNNGLDGKVTMTSGAIYEIIDGYTREAGVRNLERTITSVLRKCAQKIAAGETEKISVSGTMVKSLLGPEKVKPTFISRTDSVGIANGLAWTSVGGEMLPVEVAVIPNGTGKIEITGSLGDVMKESAQLAVTYARVHAEEYGIAPDRFKNTDLHIHAPEGAVPKDGPSAGVTLTTALVSALSGIPVRHDLAMTGEITLHGNVLPIGGLPRRHIHCADPQRERHRPLRSRCRGQGEDPLHPGGAPVPGAQACIHHARPCCRPQRPRHAPGHQPDRRRKARRQGPGHCNVKEPL